MACTKKNQSAVSAASQTETAAALSDVPMRRYAHPIPASCGPFASQSPPCSSCRQDCPPPCPCLSCPGQSQEQLACLLQMLRQQQALLEEIRTMLIQALPLP